MTFISSHIPQLVRLILAASLILFAPIPVSALARLAVPGAVSDSADAGAAADARSPLIGAPEAAPSAPRVAAGCEPPVYNFILYLPMIYGGAAGTPAPTSTPQATCTPTATASPTNTPTSTPTVTATPTATSIPLCVRYSISLDGAQEVPANASPATGSGFVEVDTVANILYYNISYSGLTGTENNAHIHGFSARGVASGVLQGLSAGSPKVGSWSFTEIQQPSILAGLAYFNIHSSAFGGGEIRGQIDGTPGACLGTPTPTSTATSTATPTATPTETATATATPTLSPACVGPVLSIGQVQGTGETSPYSGTIV
ncbi:MAG: CHRD domain-containing protein, partial [Thermoflexales bacterium]